MPQIIQSGVNPAALSGVDDVYVLVNPPNSVQLPGAATNVGAAVGSASWGPLNTPVTIGSGQDLVAAFGPPTPAANDMPSDINIMLQQGANNLRGVRVSDGTDTAAVLKLNDGSGFATDTITVGGVYASGVALSVTLTPVTGSAVVVNYTTTTADATLAGVAASLAAAINVSNAVIGANAFIKPATVVGVVITLTALVSGTAQNAIALAGTGVGVTLTMGGATFTAGAPPAVITNLTGKYSGSYANAATIRVDNGSSFATLSPTYKLTVTFPNAMPEVYDNVVAYSVLGGGFNGSTFSTNVVNAINASPQLNPARPASQYFTATAGPSTSAPLLSTVMAVSTNGSDGSTFAAGATAPQLGSDTALPKTGMYALSGAIASGQFCLSGNTDLANAAAPATSFALRENAHVVLAFPKGTSTNAAIANKVTYGIGSYAASVYKDWVEYTDSVNSISPRSISPAAFVVGKMAITSPETSPANSRMGLVTGTERTGYYTNSPYSPAEAGLLETNGINGIQLGLPSGAVFGIRHNKNSFNGDPSRNNIAYSTMTKFLAFNYSSTLIGQFVGLAQSRQPNDPLREKVRAAYNDFNERLRQQGLIDSHTVQCDLRNNSVASINSGVLRVDIVVAYLAIVDRIVVTLTGGQTVKINVNPSTLTANS